MLNSEKLLGMYKKMLLIRYFEEKLFDLFLEGRSNLGSHLSIGQEAVGVGACSNLRKNDFVTSTHRGNGHYLAKGGDPKRLMAEIFGKKTGTNEGRGGGMHVMDIDIGFLGCMGIVGAGIPIAGGSGLSAKLKGSDQVTVCFFSDGASNRGTFHEGINLASIWKLPVIFICENNLYAITTRASESLPIENIADRAASYGIPGIIVDGMDVLAVHEATKEAIRRTREGMGPTLIECKTYHFKGHGLGYWEADFRPKEEKEKWYKKDPIPKFRSKLIELKILSEEEADNIGKTVKKEILDAVKFADESPEPSPGEVLENVYA